jgi:hypothetical protein
LEGANRYYEAVIAEIQRKIEAEKYEEMPNLSIALSSMEMEINKIKRTSTWPWQPESLRWLFTPLVPPLLIWTAHYLLGRWLGR